MSKMGEKVAYLKGLAEGLGVTAETEKGKLMLAMIDTLEAFAEQAEETEEALHELQEVVDELDSDVGDLEEALLSEAEDEDDDDFFEIKCPGCGEELYIDGDILEEGSLECPKCGRVMEFHPVCDCGCDHCDDDCCEDGCCDGEDEDDD